MSNLPISKVAVSYAWKEEDAGPHAGAVEEIVSDLRSRGVDVLRDTDRIKHGESLSRFMKDVGSSEALCVFLSDAYLKSPNCMYELLIAWQRTRDDPESFRKRVKVWVMPGTVSIYTLEDRLTYTEHWNAESKRIAPLVKKHATSGLSSSELANFRKVQQIASDVSEILTFVADSLSPKSVDEFKQWVTESLPPETPVLDDQELEELFDATAMEIEQVIAQSKTLREFLASAAPGLLECNSTGTHLAKGVRSGGVDVCEMLKKIKLGLRQFHGTSDDWTRLELFVGGLVVSSVNREWVRQQSEIQSAISYPGKLDTIPLGGGRSACLIPVLTAAIARTHARLAHVFGEPNERHLTIEPPKVSRGVLTADKTTELKLHFIHYILGPDVEFDRTDPEHVDELFQMTQKALSYASTEARDPFFATSPAYQKLETVLREELHLADLLLLFPKGAGKTDELIPDPVFLFGHAFEIFQTIKLHLK